VSLPRRQAGGVPSVLSLAWERALDLVFPRRCVGCGAFGAFLCPACLSAMPRAQPPRCPGCWMPVLSPAEGPAQVEVCDRCLAGPFAFKAARCPFVYGGAAREAVHALKYDGLAAIAGTMAEAMAGSLGAWEPAATALVPVPLAGRRRRSRGYNQSELLARELSRRCGLPVNRGLLIRRRATPPLARAADEAARRAAVEGAFAVRPEAKPAGALLLVDDVMTSGATLDACARALVTAGHGPVYALTFARED
jgi:ComF family protein